MAVYMLLNEKEAVKHITILLLHYIRPGITVPLCTDALIHCCWQLQQLVFIVMHLSTISDDAAVRGRAEW